MELTPELLLEAKFGAARRGYDMAEVDDFLERCAEGLDVLLNRLRTEFERAERAEAEVESLRRQLAGGPVAEPSTEAPSMFEEPAPAREPSADEPMRILIAAERTAEAAIADARAEAERIRSEAEAIASTQRSEAESLLSRAKADAELEARRAGDEVKRAIQAEVVSLRRDRDALGDDIRILRRWLDDQRARMRTAARDLQRLAEDPSALRDIPVPETSGAALETDAGDDVAAGAEGAVDADDTPDQQDGIEEATAPDAVDDAPDEVEDLPLVPDADAELDWAEVAAEEREAQREAERRADLAGDDGEPTQAVPMFDELRPFDDDRFGDEPTDPLR